MKRVTLVKNPQTQQVQMSQQNIKLCLKNQQQCYSTAELNSVLHLQFYGFINIANLSPFINVNTLYLNNNAISKIQNLDSFLNLCTLNLSNNHIKIFQGLKYLLKLVNVDLSNNLIQQISPDSDHLPNLHTLNLSSNKIKSFKQMQGLASFKDSLTTLHLSKNELLEGDAFDLLSRLPLLSVLYLSQTVFARTTSAYRKECICALKGLVFLDDRPVTAEERLLAQAWKKGGLLLQRQVRGKIREKHIQKSDKIYQQILKNNQIREKKFNILYEKLSKRQIQRLEELVRKKEENYDMMSGVEQRIVDLQIEQEEKYLKILREAVQKMDVDKQLGINQSEIPKFMLEKVTPQAIYLYHVTSQQISLIAAKYYSEQTRPLIAVNYDSSQVKWVKEYDGLLQEAFHMSRGNLQMITPLFNLSVYEFDQQHQRKLKRFTKDQLESKCKEFITNQQIHQLKIDQLNQLD